MNEYVIKKTCPDVRDVSYMYVFFKNGDYFKIKRKEIIEVKMHLYDNLILHNREFYPVCESGYIKLKISEKKSKNESHHLYNPEDFAKDRVAYIKDRLLSGGIDRIYMFNENNWHKAFFGDAYAEADREFIIIKYKPNELYGPSGSESHIVRAGELTKSVIEKITLDFENCDSFDIFDKEIEELNLSFKEGLDWNYGGYGRQLDGGFIKLKLDHEFYWRKVHIYEDWKPESKRAMKQLERRLCGKGGEDYVDICHLYVSYNYAGCGTDFEERISVNDIRPEYHSSDDYDYDDFDCYDDDDDDDYDDEIFISGYAKKQDDGSIIIFFGGDPKSETYKKWLS